ncbi:MAG: hypothetical protein OQK69_10675 [Gammaproteobacteria bacterium]|nr:hypothetical protein [Gammaproteobacteria bacterium]
MDASANGATVEIVLNQTAIDDINTAILQSPGDKLFAIGGNLEIPNGRVAYAFAYTSSSSMSRTLTLKTTVPEPLNFANVNNVAIGAQTISNQTSITGIDTGIEISITGGEYSVNGSVFTSTAGTVSNGDTL